MLAGRRLGPQAGHERQSRHSYHPLILEILGTLGCALPAPAFTAHSASLALSLLARLRSFLGGEAEGLELDPKVELAPADRTRLRKYAAATAARWAACCAPAAGAMAPGGEGSVTRQ